MAGFESRGSMPELLGSPKSITQFIKLPGPRSPRLWAAKMFFSLASTHQNQAGRTSRYEAACCAIWIRPASESKLTL